MSNDTILQPIAFCLASDNAAVRERLAAHPFWVLEFPEDLKRRLRETQSRISGRALEESTPPHVVLNQAARLLIPDLISITSRITDSGVQPWLYGFVDQERPEEPPIESVLLRAMLNAWLRTVFRPLFPSPALMDLLQQVQTLPLVWRREEIDLCYWSQAPNGTARPYREIDQHCIQNGFVLMPDLVAARLAALELGNAQTRYFRFKRAPLAPGRRGCELVSWPPQRESQGTRTWYWSIVITVTLQTVPFQSYPQLHLNLSVRRWVSQPLRYTPAETISAYLLDSLPWLAADQQRQCFQVASLVRCSRKVRERASEETGPVLGYCWNDELVELLNELHWAERLPDPQQLTQEPSAWLERALTGRSPQAALAFRTGMRPDHGEGVGFSLSDRRFMVEQIAELLAPDFVLRSPLERYGTRRFIVHPPNPFFPQEKPDRGQPAQTRACAERRRAVAEALGERQTLTIIVRYQTATALQAVRLALCEVLGYPLESSEGTIWTTPELRLAVRSEPLGEMGRALGIKERSRGWAAEHWRLKIQERAEAIAQTLPEAADPCGVIIELPDADFFRQDGDPKAALRLGFARKGYLTQFLTPPTSDREGEASQDSLQERARSAVRDLLRQCGVLGAPPRLLLKARVQKPPFQIPEPLHYLAAWLIHRNRRGSETHLPQYLPIVVYLRSDSHLVLVRAPGFEDWLPYREAALQLARMEQARQRDHEAVRQFLLKTLHTLLPTRGETILFCDACNLRQSWPWLGNERITSSLPPELERFPQLRIVRIRTVSPEVPEWYAFDPKRQARGKDPYALSQGLFRDATNPTVFYSVQEKPPSAKNQVKSSSKLSHRPRKLAQTSEGERLPFDDPQGMAWNPRIVELTIARQSHEQRPDDVLMCAAVAHELRARIAVQFGAPTILPLPLHLAHRLEEYTLPLRPAELRPWQGAEEAAEESSEAGDDENED
ncbi:pPIWI_RE module domain-containing protein [Thermogemmatispora sp.]|uniref:pPIWI_RE module domain-containing protein n=1 Tax=Thermogemmatispora sp. TaxID=1968838 RepID=UPI001D506C3D|nr:DUF3962 domain-containing protein [Thermogemmatispora sp.]MBX5450469.1 DUF3962 domain-containing protein [Thermogemmatispora sp.]